jgi:hypothetical protein
MVHIVLSVLLGFFLYSTENGRKPLLQLIYVKKVSPYHFYTAKQLTDLKEITDEQNYKKFEKFLQYLRQKGICILTGEIEHFSKVDEISASDGQKLNMDKIFKINAKLNNGTNITEIFQIDEILEFIKPILEVK